MILPKKQEDNLYLYSFLIYGAPSDCDQSNAKDITNFITKYLQIDVTSYVEGTISAIKTPNYQLNINI